MKSYFKKLSRFAFFLLSVSAITNVNAQTNTDPSQKVWEEVEVEASFPGGAVEWSKYITQAIMANQDKLKKGDFGTCIVKFIVDVDGNVREVEATTMKRSRLAKVAIDAISKGPKWNPAQQNGKFVNAYRLQPITLTNPNR